MFGFFISIFLKQSKLYDVKLSCTVYSKGKLIKWPIRIIAYSLKNIILIINVKKM